MKFFSTLGVLAFSVASLTAQAGEKKDITIEDYYTAVLTSEHYGLARDEIVNPQLVKLELTQTFRCPGCYEFQATFEGTPEKVVEKFRTSYDLRERKIEVTITE